MDRGNLAFLFVGVALLLFLASFVLCLSYAGPEPFDEYRRVDAVLFIGGISAAITLWCVWSLGLLGAILFRAFSAWALLGLIIAAVSVFYLQMGLMGYLDDLDHMAPRSAMTLGVALRV